MGYSFKFFADWVHFGDSLNSTNERVEYYRAISRYGAYRQEPDNLNGETLKYFNKNIRPEIDRQHEKKGGINEQG